MKWQHYFLFVVIALFVFAGYASFRETIVGSNSAAFLGYSCGHSLGEIGTAVYGIHFSQWIYEHLPCDMLLFKAIACLNLLICCVIIAKTGELFDKENGWLLGLFAFSNGLFLFFMIDFEEEQFSFPFLFIASYFLLRHISKKQSWKPVWYDRNLVIGFFFVLVAGLLWKGAIYYVPLFGLYFIPIAIVYVGLWFFATEFISVMVGGVFGGIGELYRGLFQNGLVTQELMLGFGLIQQWGLLLGLLNKNKYLWPAIIYTLGLAFFAMRFSIIPIPFIGAGLILYLKNNPKCRLVLVLISIGFIVFSIINIANAFPNNEQINAVKQVVMLANGNKIENMHGFGSWINLYGGKGDISNNNVVDWNNWRGYGITDENLSGTTCKQIGKKIYYC